VYEMPDGKTGFLTATEFANKAGEWKLMVLHLIFQNLVKL
jgi:hypothetical protein